MVSSVRRTFLSLAFAPFVVFGAVNAPADMAILQLTNLTPAAGSIELKALSLSCDTTCSAAVALGDTVTLTATPAPGKRFDGWAGDCSGVAVACTLAMDGTKVVVASFKSAGDPLSAIHRFMPGGAEGRAPQGDLLALGGHLYGMTRSGGGAGGGTIFRDLPDGSEYVVLHHFLGGAFDGQLPNGSLLESGGLLYGMTSAGGAASAGTIFKLNPDGSGYTLLHTFSGGVSDGAAPGGSLVEVGGVLYGVTPEGGARNLGTIFRINPDGSGFALLHSFTGSGSFGSLIAVGGVLYGMTRGGGYGNLGMVFRINSDGSGFANLHSFGGALDGAGPYGSLIGSGGLLYGMTSEGGADDAGTIFKLDADGGGFVVLHSFAGGVADGERPRGSLISSGDVLYGMTCWGGANSGGTVFRVNPDGTGYAVMHAFGEAATDGTLPFGSLVQVAGALCGVTSEGGTAHGGTIFKINEDGSGHTVLHSLAGDDSDWQGPAGSLIVSDGVLMGMTSAGSGSNLGTIFRVNPDGSNFALLHSFAGGAGDGAVPSGSLIAVGGVLYGMTTLGGGSNLGTIFKVNPDGSGFALLHSFAGGAADGRWPSASLVASGEGLYGMTQFGGVSDRGTVFGINVDGSSFEIRHSFAGGAVDGALPLASLVNVGGVLFGMTRLGGASGIGTIFRINTDGSGYALLHSFGGPSSDGSYPDGSLVFSGGVLFGATSWGGPNAEGTVFKINADGSDYALLHAFAGGAFDGRFPEGGLIDTGGVLIGMTWAGGTNEMGTIFKVNRDGNGFALLHSFAGVDGAAPAGDSSVTPLGGSLFGAAGSGGVNNGGVLFRFAAETPRVRRHPPRL